MKPPIPEELIAIDNFTPFLYFVRGAAIWLGVSYFCYLIYGYAAAPPWLRIPVIAALMVAPGLAMFFMGLMGHEGFHGNLNSNRRVSMVMGIIVSSFVPMFMSTGYTVIHWQHHRFTNTAQDPDFALYSRFKDPMTRILFGPALVMLHAARESMLLIFRPSGERIPLYPFTPNEARLFAILNWTTLLTVMACYAYFAVVDFKLFVFLVLLPWMGSVMYFAMSPYIEHSYTGTDRGVNARTYTSKFLAFVLYNYGYHNIHHMFPRVQLHKLPALHRFLVENERLPETIIVEKSAWRVFWLGAFSHLDIGLKSTSSLPD